MRDALRDHNPPIDTGAADPGWTFAG